MNDYVEARIDLVPMPGEDATDLLAAMLGDIGFESFVPDDKGLTAYIPAALWDEKALEEILPEFPFDCNVVHRHKLIEGQDWNSEWEKNYFKPIVIGDLCVVHSSFHTNIPHAKYDIVIDPKMAFGTGHHSTTSLIIDQLLRLDFDGKSVIDMGTGTGILSILAAMRGAHPVTAIEIDEFAYLNAIENVKINGHSEIDVIHGDTNALQNAQPVDVFIANINRNVILNDIDKYTRSLKAGGIMLLSGFYVSDIPMIEKCANNFGLSRAGYSERENWTCLCLIKNV